MKKRITSLLLCFSIILSIVPSAFAEDGDIALQSGTQMYYITNAEELKALCKSRLNVTPNVAIVSLNTLPRSEKKTQRVFDHRGD